MDELTSTFLAVTGIEDPDIAKQYLELTNNDLEYAVTLYMESNPPQDAEVTSGEGDKHDNDEELAQRLQQEAYGDVEAGGVREADANIHRHETLVDSFGDGFMPGPVPSRPTDIFGGGRVGVFNQRFDMSEEDDSLFGQIEEISDDDEEGNWTDENEVLVLDSDGEVVETERQRQPVSRRRINRSNRMDDLTSTQRRLANLFRPPFDIMAKINLDTAKVEGRQQKKWILVNIQNFSEFICQVLNRDFWSQSSIKRVVRDNFLFLQYQHNSPNGVNYVNFYDVGSYPHIAILDPLTGERVFKWEDGKVPNVESWLSDVDDFLTRFSLTPGSNNPVVKHEKKFDPDALTEEQQIEFAMNQSLLHNQSSSSSKNNVNDIEAQPSSSNHKEVSSPFEQLVAKDHEEPVSTDNTTRIQIRFPNGKRLIHKFSLEDKVSDIYQWLKYVLVNSNGAEYGIESDERFILSNATNKANKLIELLTNTINEAGLKNASILIEKD